MPKDGEERKIECEMVFVFCQEDLSVGINGGWALAGIQVGKQFLEVRETERINGAGNRIQEVSFDQNATSAIRWMEEEVGEEPEEEPGG